jgi:hypothetical protein
VYVVGVVMRFAVLHRFHRLRDDGSDDTNMKIKA